MVEPYYRLMASFLKLKYEQLGSWKKVDQFFTQNKLDEVFKIMQPLILEDNLFNELGEEVEEDYAQVIVPLLQGDKATVD